jgi:hypothetical protein
MCSNDMVPVALRGYEACQVCGCLSKAAMLCMEWLVAPVEAMPASGVVQHSRACLIFTEGYAAAALGSYGGGLVWVSLMHGPKWGQKGSEMHACDFVTVLPDCCVFSPSMMPHTSLLQSRQQGLQVVRSLGQ